MIQNNLILKMKTRDVIKLVEADGWYLVRQKGSHKQYKHKIKKGLVTIAAHKMSDEIAPGTLNSILKQAQLK
jgi:predicted RNA binding protein YcfA (HicA-like mRNA interferase family)